jgi:hypothetical protein
MKINTAVYSSFVEFPSSTVQDMHNFMALSAAASDDHSIFSPVVG